MWGSQTYSVRGVAGGVASSVQAHGARWVTRSTCRAHRPGRPVPASDDGQRADLASPRRLIYWLTFAVGRSFRGFGYGLTFLPLLCMLVWNLYYMFVVEPERMLTAESRLDYPDHAPSEHRPRPWG